MLAKLTQFQQKVLDKLWYLGCYVKYDTVHPYAFSCMANLNDIKRNLSGKNVNEFEIHFSANSDHDTVSLFLEVKVEQEERYNLIQIDNIEINDLQEKLESFNLI